jgi:hypothetical protein
VRAGSVPSALVMLVVALVVSATACGGDDDTRTVNQTRPQVDQIAPAVAAVEAQLGAGQEFFEINAEPRLVNLFVAANGGSTAVPYVFLDGELQPPAPGLEVGAGITFSADDLMFDPELVLSRVTEELPASSVSRFVLLGTSEGGVRHEAVVVSARGGVLVAVLAADGSVLAVETG